MKRKSYNDVATLGPSDLVPFQVGEEAKDRHATRLSIALSLQGVVEDWAKRNGFTLRISNGGHHWKLTGPFIAQWWPSSAKLVFGNGWPDGVHCHDVEQLATLVGKKLEYNRARI